MNTREVTLRWDDPNIIERGHRVYRSKTPMDIGNMPSPIADLPKNSTEFIDENQTVGDVNYYRVSAWIDGLERYSEEIQIEVFLINGPGPQSLVGGDMTAGFFGEVGPDELISYEDISTATQMTQGTLQYNDESLWLKFALDDNILYVSKKPIRHSISWDHIHSNGCVYGDKVIDINGHQFEVTLLKGANSNPAPNAYGHDLTWTHNSEWNRLMYPIHSGIHTTSGNPSNPSVPYNQWASYSDSDLIVDYRNGNGSHNWTQETISGNTANRLFRGYFGVSFADRTSSSNTHTGRGWRAALRLIQ